MTDTVTRQDAGALADTAVLWQPWTSTATMPDALARPVITEATEEFTAPMLPKVMIRSSEADVSVEVQGIDPVRQSFLNSVKGVADLLGLPPGWNSYSAKPIEPRNVIRAIELLAELLGPKTPPPIVVPTVRGGIQLEWQTKGIDIEVYIDSKHDVCFFAEQLGSDESTEQPLAGHEHELRFWLDRVSGK